MNESEVLKKNPDIVTRVIDNETILMPIYKTSDEINCIYTLNETASKVWNMLDGKRTLGKIKEKILEDFDSTEAEVNNEMKSFLKNLKEIKAVTGVQRARKAAKKR